MVSHICCMFFFIYFIFEFSYLTSAQFVLLVRLCSEFSRWFIGFYFNSIFTSGWVFFSVSLYWILFSKSGLSLSFLLVIHVFVFLGSTHFKFFLFKFIQLFLSAFLKLFKFFKESMNFSFLFKVMCPRIHLSNLH